ncbi:MAG: LysR family transcriptional regulator [Deltaproteobacteria bacterium]|nr:MAG: LysR family transcriptional regulator [Deltaproteobacteria bacterium]
MPNNLFAMENNLDDMRVFERVASLRSFTEAAAELGLSKAAVSTRVRRLESRLGVRLLQRTTRTVRATEARADYAQHCRRILADLREAELAVAAAAARPHGLLRVTCPRLFGTLFLAPVLVEYLRTHPEVRVDVVHTERRVDLVEEGFDLGIRVGPLAPSTLVARKLGEARSVQVAAPTGDRDPLTVGPRRSEERACVDSLEMARDLAIAGLGAAWLPRFLCREALAAGTLVVLDDSGSAYPIYAVFPERRLLSERVRRFVDLLVEHARDAPWMHDGVATP